MAKAKKSKKPKKPKKPVRPAPVPILTSEQKAASIVAHVLAHFAAGYAAERQTEPLTSVPPPTVPPTNRQIFKKPSDLATFHFMLLQSTIQNFAGLNWDTNPPLRDQVTTKAFDHGVACRKTVVAESTGTLSILQILATLPGIQASCPVGAGGGLICDF